MEHLLQVRYDAELAALRGGVEQVVVELVVGPRSSPTSRKAILPHMDDLAAFLGRRSVSFPVDSHQAITILPSYFANALGRGARKRCSACRCCGQYCFCRFGFHCNYLCLPAHGMQMCKLHDKLTRALPMLITHEPDVSNLLLGLFTGRATISCYQP